jgi:hypothetical protein
VTAREAVAVLEAGVRVAAAERAGVTVSRAVASWTVPCEAVAVRDGEAVSDAARKRACAVAAVSDGVSVAEAVRWRCAPEVAALREGVTVSAAVRKWP